MWSYELCLAFLYKVHSKANGSRLWISHSFLYTIRPKTRSWKLLWERAWAENITIMQSWGERLRSKLILFLPSIERESRSVALARLVRWPVEERKRFIWGILKTPFVECQKAFLSFPQEQQNTTHSANSRISPIGCVLCVAKPALFSKKIKSKIFQFYGCTFSWSFVIRSRTHADDDL